MPLFTHSHTWTPVLYDLTFLLTNTSSIFNMLSNTVQSGKKFIDWANTKCYKGRLTCTAPGNVPSQSCAGVQAAGNAFAQESPHLHWDPGAHLITSIDMIQSHSSHHELLLTKL